MESMFIEELKASVMDRLVESDNVTDIEVKEVTKDNNKVSTGMIFKSATNLAPVIYIDDAYEDFNTGCPIDVLADRMVDTLRNSEIGFDYKQIFDFDKVKDKIFVCARNAEKNSEQLKDVPHEIRNDIAIIYKIGFYRNDGCSVVTIDNTLMECYGVSADVLHDIAWENTKRMYPVSFEDVIDTINGMLDLDVEERRGEMFVLSNALLYNGAVYGFDTEVLCDISEKLDDNLYILPSSINEVMVIPQNQVEHGSESMLRRIVGNVNQSDTVPESDYLSDNVYFYNRIKNELVIV